MAIKNTKRPLSIQPWTIKVENYLLLVRKQELLELWRTSGRSVSSLKYKSPENIRQALLSLPGETLGMVLRERNRRLQKVWHE